MQSQSASVPLTMPKPQSALTTVVQHRARAQSVLFGAKAAKRSTPLAVTVTGAKNLVSATTVRTDQLAPLVRTAVLPHVVSARSDHHSVTVRTDQLAPLVKTVVLPHAPTVVTPSPVSLAKR